MDDLIYWTYSNIHKFQSIDNWLLTCKTKVHWDRNACLTINLLVCSVAINMLFAVKVFLCMSCGHGLCGTI